MKTSEQTIKLAAKLYHHRDTMRQFWGDRYASKMEEFKGYIQRKAILSGMDEMKSVMALAKHLQENHPDSGMTQALLFAAYVEIIEPSEGGAR